MNLITFTFFYRSFGASSFAMLFSIFAAIPVFLMFGRIFLVIWRSYLIVVGLVGQFAVVVIVVS